MWACHLCPCRLSARRARHIDRTGLLAPIVGMLATAISTSCRCLVPAAPREARGQGFLDPADGARLAYARHLQQGEHGVGQGKIRYLAQERSRHRVITIKRLDPLNIPILVRSLRYHDRNCGRTGPIVPICQTPSRMLAIGQGIDFRELVSARLAVLILVLSALRAPLFID